MDQGEGISSGSVVSRILADSDLPKDEAVKLEEMCKEVAGTLYVGTYESLCYCFDQVSLNGAVEYSRS